MKPFGLARSALTAALVACAFVPAAQAAGGYDNLFVFGDSLSDVGSEYGLIPGSTPGNRWTYDKADLYADLLAAKYGIKLTPANANNPAFGTSGNDFAQGGAAANGKGDTGIPGIGDPISSQVTSYLAAHGGKADANALYTVWIGGNDISPALALAQADPVNGGANAQNYVAQAAQNAVGQVAALKAAGAKHVIVINLPDVGRTPELFNGVTQAVAAGFYAKVNNAATANALATGIAANLPGGAGNAQLIGLLTQAIQQGTATAGAGALSNAGVAAGRVALNGAGVDLAGQQGAYQAASISAEQAIGSAYASVAAQSAVKALVAAGLLPAAAADATAAQIAAGLAPQFQSGLKGTIYTNWATASAGATALGGSVFNTTESIALAKMGNVVQIDIGRVMAEVLANPKAFGFDNVTGYACPAGVTANNCSSAAAATAPDTSKQYFFADPFHPTPAAHAMVYQYIASVLDAPYYAAQLVNSQPISVISAQAAMDERYGHARSVGAIDAIARVSHLRDDFDASASSLQSDGKNTVVSVGADLQYNASTSIGLVLTHVDHDTDFAGSAGGFSANDNMLSLFARWESGPWTVGGDMDMGATRFNNIHRNVQVGALSRTETGGTSGSFAGVRVQGSYGFNMGALTISPTVSLYTGEAKVGGYAETGGDSTSMRYDQQRIDSLQLGAGVKLDADMGRVHPFFSAMAYGETKSKDRTLAAGVVGESTTFDTDVKGNDGSYATFNMGARFSFNKSVSGLLSYSYTAGLSDEKRDALSAALQVAF